MSKKQNEIDSQLVLAFQSGDTKALAILVERWHKRFCERAYWLVKDADVAKDIAQESWTVIMGKIKTLENPKSFGGWALRIVCNKALDWLNSSSRMQKHLIQIKEEKRSNLVENEVDDRTMLKAEMLKAIKTLPIHQQMVIRLFYMQGYSLKDISETLDISVGTAKSRLFHARETLKKLLKHYNYEN